jgi:hypothetical protein
MYLDGIREFGRFFCEKTFGESSVAERATMIIQETLENAIKYSVPTPDAEVEVSLGFEDDFFMVSITSTPAPEHLGVLRQELASLNEQSAHDAYIAAFQRVGDSDQTRSRIGLARVRMEGSAELQLEERADGRITVTARGALGVPAPAEPQPG